MLTPNLMKQVVHTPQPIRQTDSHSRSNAIATTLARFSRSPAEVVVGHEQCTRSSQIFQLFRESQRQPSKPLHERSDCQVVPLNMRSAYRRQVDRAEYRLPFRSYHLGRGVAARLIGVSVVLHDLSIISVGTERQVNSFGIGSKPIGGDLNLDLVGFRSKGVRVRTADGRHEPLALQGVPPRQGGPGRRDDGQGGEEYIGQGLERRTQGPAPLGGEVPEGDPVVSLDLPVGPGELDVVGMGDEPHPALGPHLPDHLARRGPCAGGPQSQPYVMPGIDPQFLSDQDEQAAMPALPRAAGQGPVVGDGDEIKAGPAGGPDDLGHAPRTVAETRMDMEIAHVFMEFRHHVPPRSFLSRPVDASVFSGRGLLPARPGARSQPGRQGRPASILVVAGRAGGCPRASLPRPAIYSHVYTAFALLFA